MPRITVCAEHCIAEVVYAQCGHAEKIDMQVSFGAADQLRLGMHGGHDGMRAAHADRSQCQADQQTQNQRRVNRFAHILLLPGAQKTCHCHVHTAAHTDHDADE